VYQAKYQQRNFRVTSEGGEERDDGREFGLHTLDQMNKSDVYRVCHPTTRENTFFSADHGTFSKINYILSHKASLKKFKNTELTPSIISDHNRIKLDLNNEKNHRKYSNIGRMNHTLLKDQWVTKI
jgi:hypothetical protein